MRRRIAANHTGTHILQAVLRASLGPHVKQAGSLVAPDRLRFDYTHFAPLTDREIQQIENNVNEVVFRNLPVQTEVKEMSDAIAAGALAFFGEKYAEQVRVVSIPDVSMELCGGTHTRMTGDIGLFKIVADSSVASGVRRIEALTGPGTFLRLEEDEELLRQLAHTLRTPRQDLSKAVTRMMEQQRQLESEVEALKLASARARIGDFISQQKSIDGTTVIAARVDGVDPSVLRELAEQIGTKIVSGVVVLGVASNGKVALVGFVSKDLQKKLHAGHIMKKVAEIVGGSGGGRPDFAQAGGKDVEKIDHALQAVYNIVAGT